MTKVLVVEDDPFGMELVLEILKTHGFIAYKTYDGAGAIKKAEKEVYDLILMDIMLPQMDGVEVTKIIKSMPRYKNVPVIALTAYAMKGDRERFLEAGFEDYIAKPIEIDEFIKKIEKYKK